MNLNKDLQNELTDLKKIREYCYNERGIEFDSLSEVDKEWRCFSSDCCASFLCVSSESLIDFVDWLLD